MNPPQDCFFSRLTNLAEWFVLGPHLPITAGRLTLFKRSRSLRGQPSLNTSAIGNCLRERNDLPKISVQVTGIYG